MSATDAADQQSGAKRRAAEAGLVPAASGGATASTRLTVSAGAGDFFNDHFLRFFYSKLFPYKLMFRWLSYGNGACTGKMARAQRIPPRRARAPRGPPAATTPPPAAQTPTLAPTLCC